MSFNGMNFSYASDIRIGQNQISALYFGNKRIWPRDPEEIYLVLTSEEDDNDFYFFARTSEWALDIEVSYNDGKTWETFTSSIGSSSGSGTYIGTLDTGERMCIRGLNNTYADIDTNANKYCGFRSDGKFKASGNIMGLIYGKNSDIYGYAFPENTSQNFAGLFDHSKITDISRLKFPAITLTPYCYGAMFNHCTELVDLNINMLPATTLAPNCYITMFGDCTNLQEAPILPATILVERCYNHMFVNCSKIDYIKMLATNISATDCLAGWVANVAPTGIFIKDYYMTSIPVNSTSGIPVGWIYEEENVPDFSAIKLTIQSQEANNTITYSGSDIDSLYYKIGDTIGEFQKFPSAGVTINANEKIILQAELSTVLGTFTSTGNFIVYGNIQSLNNFGSSLACTGGLFSGCTGLTDARYLILPQTTVPAKGYNRMFRQCSSLVTAPKIEATQFNSNSLQNMFQQCTNLTTIRPFTINNNASNVCRYMFHGCSSLVMVPEITINVADKQSCQYMFMSCTSLIDASRIKMPTDIRDQNACQSMFNGCENLKNVPELPATTLTRQCYSGMFANCTSLTTAPKLPATTLADYCYYQMFYYCNNLNSITCLATDISALHCTTLWVQDVANSGTFVKDPNMNSWVVDSVNGIPTGWTVTDYVSNS